MRPVGDRPADVEAAPSGRGGSALGQVIARPIGRRRRGVAGHGELQGGGSGGHGKRRETDVHVGRIERHRAAAGKRTVVDEVVGAGRPRRADDAHHRPAGVDRQDAAVQVDHVGGLAQARIQIEGQTGRIGRGVAQRQAAEVERGGLARRQAVAGEVDGPQPATATLPATMPVLLLPLPVNTAPPATLTAVLPSEPVRFSTPALTPSVPLKLLLPLRVTVLVPARVRLPVPLSAGEGLVRGGVENQRAVVRDGCGVGAAAQGAGPTDLQRSAADGGAAGVAIVAAERCRTIGESESRSTAADAAGGGFVEGGACPGHRDVRAGERARDVERSAADGGAAAVGVGAAEGPGTGAVDHEAAGVGDGRGDGPRARTLQGQQAGAVEGIAAGARGPSDAAGHEQGCPAGVDVQAAIRIGQVRGRQADRAVVHAEITVVVVQLAQWPGGAPRPQARVSSTPPPEMTKESVAALVALV